MNNKVVVVKDINERLKRYGITTPQLAILTASKDGFVYLFGNSAPMIIGKEVEIVSESVDESVLTDIISENFPINPKPVHMETLLDVLWKK